MPLKGSNSTTIKDYLSTMEIQSGKNKNSVSKENSPTMPKEGDTKANKPSIKTPNILKEASASSKAKMQTTQKHQKDEITSITSINKHNPTSQKRNASNRSPLEGHPDKKHKEVKTAQPSISTITNHDSSDNEEECTSLVDTCSQDGNNSPRNPIHKTAKNGYNNIVRFRNQQKQHTRSNFIILVI